MQKQRRVGPLANELARLLLLLLDLAIRLTGRASWPVAGVVMAEVRVLALASSALALDQVLA